MGIKPEGRFKDELVDELIKKKQEHARAKDALKADTKARKGRIEALADRIDEIVDLLDGKGGVQTPLPLLAGKDGKKPPPPPIEWKHEKGGVTGYVLGVGTYRVELGLGGKYDVAFGIPGTKPKNIGSAPTETEAKLEIAQPHHLKVSADGILANSGDSKLIEGGGRKKKAGAGAAP